jgi:hypothetical protein
MAKYSVFQGTFTCHTCKAEVKTLRLYPGTKELTWMCPDRHVSSVSLSTKKSRKDFSDEA